MNFLPIFFLAFSFLFHPFSVYSASISFSESSPSEISSKDQDFTVRGILNINTEDGTIYFLRGVFYREGSNNYCGFTWNGESWFNGPYTSSEGWKKLPKVTISSSSAEISLKVRIDSLDSGCRENGNYFFRIQRYTQSGSASFDEQNVLKLAVAFPTQVPTVTRTEASNTPLPKPTTTPVTQKVVIPTSVPQQLNVTARKIDQILPTSPSMQESSMTTVTIENEYKDETVLGLLNESQTPVPAENKKETKGSDHTWLLRTGGVAGVLASVYLSVRNIRRKMKGGD